MTVGQVYFLLQGTGEPAIFSVVFEVGLEPPAG